MPETIPPRPDETFNEQALAAWLHGRLPGTDQPLHVRQFGGGAANLTYLLDYGNHQYVLRRPPLGPVAPGAHDMGREFRVLHALHRAYPLAPQAYLFCEDENIIGAPFFIMERRHGLVVRTKLPAGYATIPDAPQRICAALVDALAALHAVDYEAIGLGQLGKPAGFIHRQVHGWYRRWQAAHDDPLPLMEQIYSWLCENLPPDAPGTLVHNDFKLDNVMLAAEDPGRVVAVFDWDMCTLGDPLSDLGALLTYWTEPADPPELQAIARTFMPTGDPRFWTRAQLAERYAQRSGRDLTHLRFYHVLGLFRVAVIIAQIYIRYRRGQTQDQRFAAFGPLVPLLARAAAGVIG